MSPREAAELIGVNAVTLRRYRHQGKLKALRLPGGGIRYNRNAVLGLLEPVRA